MKICVLMKQVPDKDSSIKISMDNLSIDESIVSFTTNESDAYALEEALQIKEKTDGEVVICTFGKESAIQVVKDGLAKGADRAIFISNTDKENLDIYKASLSGLINSYLLRKSVYRPLDNKKKN